MQSIIEQLRADCPACEFARKRGELSQLTADGCPICDDPEQDACDILNEIEIDIEIIEKNCSADATDLSLMRVALRELITDLPDILGDK